MQEAAQRMHEPGGSEQARGHFLIRLAQFTQPIDQMQVAQAARRFLDVGLQMIERALEFFVALARELAKVAGERAGLALEERRKLAFELGVKIGAIPPASAGPAG